jgi:heme/copper-type cytochrome/quinol oxidase subunit 3
VKLFALALVLVVLMMSVMGLWFGVFGDSPGEQESPPVWVQVPVIGAFLVAAVSALSGGALAIVAIRHGDRSGLLFLPFAAALMALTFVVGEVAVPH